MPPTHDFLLRLGVPVSGYSHRLESFEVRSQSQKQRQPRPSGALLARRSRGTASGRGGAAPPPGHPGPERAERGPLGRGSARSRSDRLSLSGAPVTSPITPPALGSHDNRANGLSLPFPCRVDGNLAHPVLNQDDFDVAGSRNRPRGECGLAGSAARLARAPRSRLARSGRRREALVRGGVGAIWQTDGRPRGAEAERGRGPRSRRQSRRRYRRTCPLPASPIFAFPPPGRVSGTFWVANKFFLSGRTQGGRTRLRAAGEWRSARQTMPRPVRGPGFLL